MFIRYVFIVICLVVPSIWGAAVANDSYVVEVGYLLGDSSRKADSGSQNGYLLGAAFVGELSDNLVVESRVQLQSLTASSGQKDQFQFGLDFRYSLNKNWSMALGAGFSVAEQAAGASDTDPYFRLGTAFRLDALPLSLQLAFQSVHDGRSVAGEKSLQDLLFAIRWHFEPY
jgi:hypothetical protein